MEFENFEPDDWSQYEDFIRYILRAEETEIMKQLMTEDTESRKRAYQDMLLLTDIRRYILCLVIKKNSVTAKII